MLTISRGLEASIEVLRTALQNIENNVVKTRREGEVDKKTISMASRLIELLEKMIRLLEVTGKRVQALSENQGIVTLSQYMYAFQAQNEVVVIKTRPEYVALVYNSEKNSVSLKTKRSILTITPSSLTISTRGVSINVSPLNREQFMSKRDELRIALKTFEKVVYKKLLPYIEQHVSKK